MRLKDVIDIVEILGEEWNLGKRESEAKGNVCAWIYFCDFMSETEKMVIERKDGRVIGICGYAKWNSKRHLLRKKFYATLKAILINSRKIKNKQALLTYYRNYNYTPKELENYFDGEISIIIVNKQYRGLGIGKKMILKIFEYAKNDNIKNLRILTDESCNYKFYENVDCKKIYEEKVYNYEPGSGKSTYEMGYIYEKQFNKNTQ